MNKLRVDEGCDIVIALTHLGFEDGPNGDCDKALAANTSGIDFILGGHSHTFLPEPVFVKNVNGEPVFINQVGYGGVNVGRIEIGADASSRAGLISAGNMVVG